MLRVHHPHKLIQHIWCYFSLNAGVFELFQILFGNFFISKKNISTCMLHVLSRDGPLLVVASGRDTIPVSSAIKHLAPENVFVVQVKFHFPPKKSCICLAGKYLILILLLKNTLIYKVRHYGSLYTICVFSFLCAFEWTLVICKYRHSWRWPNHPLPLFFFFFPYCCSCYWAVTILIRIWRFSFALSERYSETVWFR